jgi:hypothetical protein
MDDLLKEAIADAKAVRETALENAKMALEEAFTPRLQNMLSQKIQNEIEDEDDEKKDEVMDDEEDIEERDDEDDMEERSMMKAADEDPSDEDSEEMDESEIIEIDGVKYAPVLSEEEDEDEMDEIDKEDDEDMEEDLDLESVIKELESELDEVDKDDDKEEVEEQSKSSGIGAGDNKVANASSGDEEDPGKGKLKEMKDKDDEEMDEDIDLDEVLKALSEEEDEDEEKNEVSELKSDLAEHRSVIETLRGKLNEVNLLNAKLLFTNKLFRKHGLNNEQKMKVVEQFDRASNLREVKLVYSTLGESFGARKNEINEHKGSASKPIASTKSEKKVISESTELRDRFKKLANLI